METIKEIEDFYGDEYTEHDLKKAINNVNSRIALEMTLREKYPNEIEYLSIRDYVFTNLSYKSGQRQFMYIWNSFNEVPELELMIKTSYDVIKDKFENKNKVAMIIRTYLAKRQLIKNSKEV